MSFNSIQPLFLLASITLWSAFVYAVEPDNNDFANAQLITGTSGTTSGSNVDADFETGEPDPFGEMGDRHTVWYKWVAPNSTAVDIDTFGSDYDTTLAVYTGTLLTNLVELTVNDDDPKLDFASSDNLASRVSFTPTMGTTYYIMVDGAFGDTGSITLNWGPPPPLISISGTLSLPLGDSLNSTATIIVGVVGNVSDRVSFTSVTLGPGTDSDSYFLMAFEDAAESYHVFYDCDMGCEGYETFGAYQDDGSTAVEFDAVGLDGDLDNNNVPLELIRLEDNEEMCFPIKAANGNVAVICL